MTELAHVLRPFLATDHPAVLVGALSGDDAAVYALDDHRALVTSVDFITPVVDDPRTFGSIAAANALSDLYAMGATPLFALNIVAFPRDRLEEGVLEAIIRGAADKAHEAGVPILGGHSIDDPEPKFGMVVVGEVHADRLVTNRDARPGDRLVLTKPLGSGVLSAAVKGGGATPQAVAAGVATMTALNAAAAAAMVESGVRAATDVTGYGLLGHLRNLLRASGVSARIRAARVPLLPTVLSLVEAGYVPGATDRNARDLDGDVHFAPGVTRSLRTILVDPQTSGGLLMAVPEEKLDPLLEQLRESESRVAVVGRVSDEEAGFIRVE